MGRVSKQYSNVKRGPAIDLSDGHYYMSGWERDIARWLTVLQFHNVIEGWDYEPQVFTFQGLGYKRGPFTYIPDFVVKYSDNLSQPMADQLRVTLDHVEPGLVVYWEVKGQEKGSDRSKWRRFRKHTGYPLEVIKKDKMIQIQKIYSSTVNGWESRVRR